MQLLGVVAVLIFWAGVFLLLNKWPVDHSLTISKHVAVSRETYRFFTPFWLISDILLAVYVIIWFVPQFDLGSKFLTVFLIGLGCNFIAGIIPDRKGWQTKIHSFLAYAAAACMPLLAYLIAVQRGITSPVGLFAIAICAYMICTVVIYLTIKNTRKYFLVAQSTYIAGIHLVILVASFI